MVTKQKTEEITSTFTVDSDASQVVEVPSVTRLLNRKSLSGLITSPKTQTAPLPQSLPSAMPDLPLPLETATPDTPSLQSALQAAEEGFAALESPPEALQPLQEQHNEISLSFASPDSVIESSPTPEAPTRTNVKIQPARAVTRPAAPTVARWSQTQLSSSADPLAQGMARLMEIGVSRALFLATGPTSGGSAAPVFQASAALAADDCIELWTGLKWDPSVAPDTWNQFVKGGLVELAPPSTQTNVKSNRNVIRAAFGVGKSEWLILIRAGSLQKCRGVLAVVSSRPILNEIPQAASLIASAILVDKTTH